MNDAAPIDALGLLPALKRLDALLVHAADAAAELYGPDAITDPYRGLVIGPDEIRRLLRRTPGDPSLSAAKPDAFVSLDERGGQLAWLGSEFDLDPLDLDLLLIAIAPELDLRYERLYGYLQDDVTRRRPSVDLALNLLCGSAVDRIEARTRVAPDAPLLRHHLLHLIVDPNHPHQPLLAQTMKADDQVLRLVLGESSLDPRLASCAEMVRSRRSLGSLPLDPATRRALPLRAVGASPERSAPRLYLQGEHDAGQRVTAEALAAEADLPLLVINLARAARADTPIGDLLRIAFREAWFRRAAILVTGIDCVPDKDASETRDQLLTEVSQSHVLTMVAGKAPWGAAGWDLDRPAGIVVVPFPVPGVTTRKQWWEQVLTGAAFPYDDEAIDVLARQYRLSASRIVEAVATARNRADWTGTKASIDDLFAEARAQSGQGLAALARKVDHVATRDSLVLPRDALAQLGELKDRVAQRQTVLADWGFDRALALGKGTCALFAGPSGTGKTMAADVVAGELGLDLYKIDLATVVSKYIGETEKNLERIFTEAETANAVLFFDEADAIFGKRSEVRDAHDRYANLEISYLLQRMEEYDGIAILATNLRENLDDAFLRRLHFIVDFPMPDEKHREQMWRSFLPADAPIDSAIDYTYLAREFQISGGNIKNIVVSAAYLASANGGRIGMPHLLRATRREYQKIGRVFADNDTDDYARTS